MNGVIMVNTAPIKSVFKYNDTKLYLYKILYNDNKKKNGTYLSQHRHPHIDYHICSIYIPFFIRGWIKKNEMKSISFSRVLHFKDRSTWNSEICNNII